ncbi:hypothetical protein SAMN05421636_104335 [Pricia antarctica]|uniref:Uncharacterized protein n=1 Tax=Pricia antarctica TaxID=641691 RepID=A0A1G7BXJ6_9FLAO|nr:hypothetical protein SAMN05421636_104335 [Pricia antarctica]
MDVKDPLRKYLDKNTHLTGRIELPIPCGEVYRANFTNYLKQTRLSCQMNIFANLKLAKTCFLPRKSFYPYYFAASMP